MISFGKYFGNFTGLRALGIYIIPCECGRVYTVKRGRSIQLRLAKLDESAVPEPCIDHDGIIKVGDT